LVRAWTRTFGLKATISNCGNNYGPYQHIEKFIPRQITSILENKKPKIYGNGLNVRDWIHVDDHSSAILSILNKGKIGRTYLIGVNGQKNNLEVIKIILQVMNKPSNWFDFVKDRDGHDLRYAIDPSKTMNELGWKPSHLNLKEEIKSVVEWYANNPWFWKHQKEKVEQMYKNRGQ
jgi:dTDP-glucose 4,6-dehydratase